MSTATTLSATGESAVMLADMLGFAVFLLAPRGKEPLISKSEGGNGFHDASNDLELTRARWLRYPSANVGIATGRRSGVVVLDVDPRNGGHRTLAQLIAKHGPLPHTLMAYTGGGGEHYFFSYPQDREVRCGVLAPGLDIKADGGYVVAAPSLHPSGNEYQWAVEAQPGVAELMPLPAWVLEQMAGGTSSDVGPGEDAAKSYLGIAFEAVGWLGKRLGDGRRAVICPWRHEHSSGRDFDTSTVLFPPRPGSTLGWFKCSHSHCCGRGGKEVLLALPREAREAADRAYPRDVPPGSDGPSGETATESGETERKSRFALRSGVDIAKPLPRIPWLCKALSIGPGRPTILGGYGGVGKTFTAQALALAIAAGHTLLWDTYKIEHAGGKVLHIDHEQGQWITDWRYQRLAWSLGVDLGALGDRLQTLHYPDLYLTSADAEAGLIELCTGRALVLIDSLRAACPGVDENDSKMGSYLYMLARVSEKTGAVIVVIHHEGKTSGDNPRAGIEKLRGSSAIAAGAGSVLSFVKDPAGPGVIRIEHTRANLGQEAPAELVRLLDEGEVDPETGKSEGLRFEHMPPEQVTQQADAAHDEAREGELRLLCGRVLGCIERNPGIAGASTVARKLKIRDRQALDALVMLRESGAIENRGGKGKGARWHIVASGSTGPNLDAEPEGE